MALGDRSPPTAPGECGFYSSFTLKNQVTTRAIFVRWYQNGRELHSGRSLSTLCLFGHSTEILRGLGKIPLHHSFGEEIWSFIHLCYMKDDFSMASIGGFRNELFLKILSLSFEKKLQAYRTFRGCVKSANIPKFPGKRLNARNFGRSSRDLAKSRTELGFALSAPAEKMCPYKRSRAMFMSVRELQALFLCLPTPQIP